MKLPKNLGKKIVSVALCTMFLSAGSLQALTSVSHALTTTNQTSEATETLWETDVFFKLKHRMMPMRKTFAKVRLIARNDNSVKMEYVSTNNGTNLNQLLLDDEFLLGFKSKEQYISNVFYGNNLQQVTYKWLAKNNSTSGTHAYMSDASSLKELISKFNAANPKIGDCLFVHGVNYSDTVTFSSDKITRPSSKDYSLGYKSRGIDRWKNGFELTKHGLYECPLINSTDMASYIY